MVLSVVFPARPASRGGSEAVNPSGIVRPLFFPREEEDPFDRDQMSGREGTFCTLPVRVPKLGLISVYNLGPRRIKD